MAATSASTIGSKLLNLRTTALYNLIRRPSAAVSSTRVLQSTSTSAAVPDSQLFNLFDLKNARVDSPSVLWSARDLNLHAFSLPMNLRSKIGGDSVESCDEDDFSNVDDDDDCVETNDYYDDISGSDDCYDDDEDEDAVY